MERLVENFIPTEADIHKLRAKKYTEKVFITEQSNTEKEQKRSLSQSNQIQRRNSNLFRSHVGFLSACAGKQH